MAFYSRPKPGKYSVMRVGRGSSAPVEYDNIEDVADAVSVDGTYWIEDFSGWAMRVEVDDGVFMGWHIRHDESEFGPKIDALYGTHGKRRAFESVRTDPMRYASRPYRSRWDDIREHLHEGYEKSMDLIAERDEVTNVKHEKMAEALRDIGLEGGFDPVDSMPKPASTPQTIIGPFRRKEFDLLLGDIVGRDRLKEMDRQRRT